MLKMQGRRNLEIYRAVRETTINNEIDPLFFNFCSVRVLLVAERHGLSTSLKQHSEQTLVESHVPFPERADSKCTGTAVPATDEKILHGFRVICVLTEDTVVIIINMRNECAFML